MGKDYNYPEYNVKIIISKESTHSMHKYSIDNLYKIYY